MYATAHRFQTATVGLRAKLTLVERKPESDHDRVVRLVREAADDREARS